MEEVFWSDMVSPFSGQLAYLIRGCEWVEYGSYRVPVISEWFRCPVTGEEFTSMFQDEHYLKNLHRAVDKAKSASPSNS